MNILILIDLSNDNYQVIITAIYFETSFKWQIVLVHLNGEISGKSAKSGFLKFNLSNNEANFDCQ